MAIKNVLVHVANDACNEGHLNFAVDLFRHVADHLGAVLPIYPITEPTGAAGRVASNTSLAEAPTNGPKLSARPSPFISWTGAFSKIPDCNRRSTKKLARRAHPADMVITGQSTCAGYDYVAVKKMKNLTITPRLSAIGSAHTGPDLVSAL